MLPVSKILYSVKELLSKIDTIDVQSVLDKGLKNKIEFVDIVGGHTTLSHITSDGQVVLSIGFCQMLWNLCYVALRNSECKRFEDSCTELHAPSELLKQVILDVNRLEFAYLTDVFKAEDDERMLSVGYNCIDHVLTKEETAIFDNIDLNTAFCQTVNGVCGAAVTFVLLHEFFHWERDHFYRRMRRIDMEREADKYAFETMVHNFTGKEKNTVILGALCCLCANFFLNPGFTNDGSYPFEDDRLFSQFDEVGSNDIYALVVDRILSIWAGFFHKSLAIKLESQKDSNDRIKVIRKELTCYGRDKV